MARSLRLLISITVIALAAAACGGGDSSDDDANAKAKTDASASGTDADASAGAAVGAGVFTSAKCAQAVAALAGASQAVGRAAGGTVDALKTSTAQLEAFADEAPSEIRADLRAIADAYSTYVTAVAAVKYDPASGQRPTEAQAAQLSAAADQLDKADLDAASERVGDWFANKCGK